MDSLESNQREEIIPTIPRAPKLEGLGTLLSEHNRLRPLRSRVHESQLHLRGRRTLLRELRSKAWSMERSLLSRFEEGLETSTLEDHALEFNTRLQTIREEDRLMEETHEEKEEVLNKDEATLEAEERHFAAQKDQAYLDIFMVAVAVVAFTVLDGFLLAVILALSSFAVTLAMTLAISRKDDNLVRILLCYAKDCETMGNATTICSDKTGTLTQNRIIVVADNAYDVCEDISTNPTQLSSQTRYVEDLAVVEGEIRKLTNDTARILKHAGTFGHEVNNMYKGPSHLLAYATSYWCHHYKMAEKLSSSNLGQLWGLAAQFLRKKPTEEFPRPESGIGTYLTEDFAMRGQVWCEQYLPSNFFDDCHEDDEERRLEMPSMCDSRVERCLYQRKQLSTVGISNLIAEVY
jgi:cell division protein FtsL